MGLITENVLVETQPEGAYSVECETRWHVADIVRLLQESWVVPFDRRVHREAKTVRARYAACLRARLGDHNRSTPSIAALDALPALHRIGPDGIILICDLGGTYRALLLDLEPLSKPPNGHSVSTADSLPVLIEETGEERVVALLTGDGRYLVRPDGANESIETWDLQLLSSRLLSRAVASAWRDNITRADDPPLEAALPFIRSTFRRFVLQFALERIESARSLAQKERGLWETDPAARLDLVAGLLTEAEQEFGDITVGLESMYQKSRQRDIIYRHFGTITFHRGETLKLRKALEKALNRLRIARTQHLFSATSGNGAAGFVQPEDIHEGDARRAVNDAKLLVLSRLDDLLQNADNLRTQVQEALEERERIGHVRKPHPIEADLLALRPVVDVALAWGFGSTSGEHEDAYQAIGGREIWAAVPAELLETMREELLRNLPKTELQELQNLIMLGSIFVVVVTGGLGILMESALLPLFGAVITYVSDGYEIWLLYEQIELYAEIAHIIQGVPGHQDPDLALDLKITLFAATLSLYLDLRAAPKAWKEFFGNVSTGQLIARSRALRGMRSWLREVERNKFNSTFNNTVADMAQNASRRLFLNADGARTWLNNLSSLSVSDLLARIEEHGGWTAVEEGLKGLGVATDPLRIARDRVLEPILSNHPLLVKTEYADGSIELVVKTAEDATGALTAIREARTAFADGLSMKWEHLLGTRALLKIESPGDGREIMTHLLDLWKRDDGTVVNPASWPHPHQDVPDGVLTQFIEGVNELGGWNALGRQTILHELPETAELVRYREEFVEYLGNEFKGRGTGSSGLGSDLDFSIMYVRGQPGIAVRTGHFEEFLARTAGIPREKSHLWETAFNMQLFVDPSLAAFYDRITDRSVALVLAHHIFERQNMLAEIIRRPGKDLLLGYDLLTEYARHNPFSPDLLVAGIHNADNLSLEQLERAIRGRHPDVLRSALAKLMDDALNSYDDALNAVASGNELLDKARRVSDVAIAQALANDEAYFLAGTTKTMVTLRDGLHLFKGIDDALAKVRRVHLEELESTITENWFVHVVPSLEKVLDQDFLNLAVEDREKLIAKAFFQLGKYGNMRAVGFFVDPELTVERMYKFAKESGPALEEKMGIKWLRACKNLAESAKILRGLGKELKSLRTEAAPRKVLEVLGKLTQEEIETLRRQRDLADFTWRGPHLGPEDEALLNHLSGDELVQRAREALQDLTDILVGRGANLHSEIKADSVLGELKQLLARGREGELIALDRWLVERFSTRGAKALGLALDSDDQPESRLLGASPPDDDVLDVVDRDYLYLGRLWAEPPS